MTPNKGSLPFRPFAQVRTQTLMPQNAKGFTLIEIMTALAVLAIAFVILLGLRNRDVALSEEALYITQATLLARQKISEITLDENKETGAQNGDFGESYPAYTWEVVINETEFPALREFIVRVIWKNRNREEKVQFFKYFFVKQ